MNMECWTWRMDRAAAAAAPNNALISIIVDQPNPTN